MATDRGGAIFNQDSNPILRRCTFSGDGNGTSQEASVGGGVYVLGGDPVLRLCTFTRLDAGVEGGGLYVVGDGVTAVIDSTFDRNIAANVGGAVQVTGVVGLTPGTADVIACRFINNDAGISGGGLTNHFESTADVTTSLFSANTAGSSGGGLYSTKDAVTTVVNCTFSANTVPIINAGGGLRNVQSTLVITNTITWGNVADGVMNEAAQISAPAGPTTVTYTCIQDQTIFTGTGNIGLDPLFADAANGNYRLTEVSPCIDAGNTVPVPEDLKNLDNHPPLGSAACGFSR